MYIRPIRDTKPTICTNFFFVQGEYKLFPSLQTFITRKLRGIQTFFTITWIIFQQDGAPPHWGSHVRRFLVATFSNSWTGRDSTTPWPPRSPDIIPLDFFLWGYVKDKVFSTPVPDITNLKARMTDAFCHNNWRHVGEQVERNWLSIRRSPCNKRSTCWSVLMCCKKNFLSWVTFWKKKYVCIPRRFLVMFVIRERLYAHPVSVICAVFLTTEL